MNIELELQGLKSAWSELDRKLDAQNAQLLQQARRGRLQSLRHKLRPLAWGQTLQILLGIVVILLGVATWQHTERMHLVVAGVVVHLYGVAMIILGGITHSLLARLDLDAPVIEVQRWLARLRRTYVIGSTTLGLAWWLLWVPFSMALFEQIGVDFYRSMTPPIVLLLFIGGVLGLAATWAFDRWARQRPSLHRALRRAMAGESLSAAAAELEAIERFERE